VSFEIGPKACFDSTKEKEEKRREERKEKNKKNQFKKNVPDLIS